MTEARIPSLNSQENRRFFFRFPLSSAKTRRLVTTFCPWEAVELERCDLAPTPLVLAEKLGRKKARQTWKGGDAP